MFQRASNTGVHFLLARVKFVPTFSLFCRKSELCRNFALFGGIFFVHFGTLCYFFAFFSAHFGTLCYFLAFFLHYLGLFGLLSCYVVN